MKKKLLSAGIKLFLLLLVGQQVQAQPKTDSLKKLYNTASHDTLRAQLLDKIFEVRGDYTSDTCFRILNRIMALSERGLKKYTGNRESKAFQKSLLSAQINTAVCYERRADVKNSLVWYFKALKLATQLGDLNSMAVLHNNIGYIYFMQGKSDDAVRYFKKAVDINRHSGNKKELANSYVNLGSIIAYNQHYGEGIGYLKKAAAIYSEINDADGQTSVLNNTGHIYMSLGDLDSALYFFNRCLDLYQETHQYGGMASTYINISDTYSSEREWTKAKQFALKALEAARQSGSAETLAEASEWYSNISYRTGDYKDAYDFYVKYKKLRDSLSNDQIKKLAYEKDLQFQYEKKAAADSLKQVHEDKLVEAQRKAERTERYALYTGLAMLLVFGGFIYNRFRITHRQKHIIEEQNKIVERQKQAVEEKNREITDSINYARRIQYALLAHDTQLKENLPEHFVYFQPKDIVSGDFYWATQTFERLTSESSTAEPPIQTVKPSNHQTFYLAVCDSTGHGVPGAFMSLLNISFLNEAITEKNITDPARVFDHVRQRLIENISQEGQKDGMDGILLRFETQNPKLKINYAAANNFPLVVRGQKMIELPYDKMPIGKGENNTGFASRDFELQPGDMLYLYTDGYADQFGGERGKKFKHSQLHQLLAEISVMPAVQQKQILEQRFEAWKNDLEQVDDVCIIGIRF